MNRIKTVMASAFVLAILGAFATKSNASHPLTQTGYVFVSPHNCKASITVPCHAGAAETCTISGVTYYANANCDLLTRD